MRTPDVYNKQIAPLLRQVEECLIFSGAKRNGYGCIKVGGRRGKVLYTHRVVYETFIGELQAGLHIMHSCNNPACCNPAHLSQGTPRANAVYAVASGRHVPGLSPLSSVGVRGVCAVRQSGKVFFRAYGRKPNRISLYWGLDFFQAICARKSWENRNPLAKGDEHVNP